MKKTPLISGLLVALNLSLFNSISAFAGSLVIEVPDDPAPTTETVVYQCDTGTSKERVEATYLNADNISLVDFKWKGRRVIASNVISASGAKYMGDIYVWWTKKDEAIFYDLINDPEEEKPIRCVEEKA
ncbi:MliC family protein [Bartonella sp. B12(2025)]